MAKCRSCGAEIMWLRTENGKSMPCNEGLHYYNPNEGRTTYITTPGKVKTGRKLGYDEHSAGAELGYTPHWSTCSNADKYRTKA